MPVFVRFQSSVPNRRGTYPGVFALANGLASDGLLTEPDRVWWRAANDRADALYAQPSTVDPRCYDTESSPGARAWFKESATELIAMTQEYLALLDRYGIGWVELRTSSPGRISYEDDVQVVAVPGSYPGDWPFVIPGG